MCCPVKRFALGLSVLLLTGACASKKKPPTPRSVSEPCAGQAVLIIDNGSGYELDVLEARLRTSVRTVITTVGTGHHEVTVRSEGGYYYFTRRARTGITEASESVRRSASDSGRALSRA